MTFSNQHPSPLSQEELQSAIKILLDQAGKRIVPAPEEPWTVSPEMYDWLKAKGIRTPAELFAYAMGLSRPVRSVPPSPLVPPTFAPNAPCGACGGSGGTI